MGRIGIKDIAKYYPYKLKFRYQYQDMEVGSINKARDFDEYFVNRDHCKGIHQIKPIFRPLSGLIEEIEHGGERFIPIVELAKLALFEPIGYESIETTITQDNNAKWWYYEVDFVFDEGLTKLGFDFGKGSEGDNYYSFSCRCPHTTNDKPLNQEELFQKLYEWHFWTGDQSLFEEGLLIEKE